MRGTVSVHHNPETSHLPLLAKALLLADGEPGGAQEIADRLGLPERVKAAIAPHLTSDADAASVMRRILTSFAPLLRNSSAFFRAFDMGMVRMPLRTRIQFMSSPAVMGRRSEG